MGKKIAVVGTIALVAAVLAWSWYSTPPIPEQNVEAPAETPRAPATRLIGASDEVTAAPGRVVLPVVAGEPVEAALASEETEEPDAAMHLEVVSALTEEHLPNVSVVAMAPGTADAFFLYPGEHGSVSLVRGGVSPVRIPCDELGGHREMVLWVGAAGHVWQRTTVVVEPGATEVVRLPPGGDLVVNVTGELPDGGAVLRLRQDVLDPRWGPEFREVMARWGGSERATAPIAETGKLTWDGLPEGRYTVQVERVGRSAFYPVVLGRAEATVVRGDASYVTVIAQRVRKPQETRLGGTVRIPSGWDLKELEVQIEPELSLRSWPQEARALPASNLERIGADLYRWDAGEVLAGSYWIGVTPAMGLGTTVVPPAGLRDLHLEVPAPVETIVQVVDATTGEFVPLQTARWISEFPSSGFVPSLNRCAGVHDGEFEIRSVPGLARLRLESRTHGVVEVQRELVGGTLRVPIEPECGVRVTVQVEGASWAFDPSWTLVASPLDGGEPVEVHAGEVDLAPGTYLIQVRLDDERVTDTIAVNIKPGRTSELTLNVRSHH